MKHLYAYHSAKDGGFSLVELSIVLVILGLLTGGILTGQSLIRAAELRDITTELQQFHTVVNIFEEKYFALPGDMPNATQFWGAAHATPSICSTTPSTTQATCNGNGNFIIDGWQSHSLERHRAWQHLSNAGLISGRYTGVGGPGGWQDCVPGENNPQSSVSNTAFGFFYIEPKSGNSGYFDGVYGNTIIYGGDAPTGLNKSCDEYVLKAEETWSIDKKFDDAKPGTGKIRTYNIDWATLCVNGASISAEYNLTSTSSSACNLIYLLE